MPSLLEALTVELERPREITAQVLKHLLDTYGLTREAIGKFLVSEMPKLEEYEVDLILAPLFTPTLAEQSVFAEMLGQESVPMMQWPGLVQHLVARPTRGNFVTDDGATHSVSLRGVTVERFVHRLRLDGTIPEPGFKLIGALPQTIDRAFLKAVARRAIWETAARREILVRYLEFAGDAFRADDAVALVKLVETYEPTGVPELLAQIPHWERILHQEINDSGAKPFFNERVEELHGGGRDQRRREDANLRGKEAELSFLSRLQQVLRR